MCYDFVRFSNTTSWVVGGRSPTGGVAHDIARSETAFFEVRQEDARKFEVRPIKTGTARQWEETRGEGAEAVQSDFEDTPSFLLQRK